MAANLISAGASVKYNRQGITAAAMHELNETIFVTRKQSAKEISPTAD